ncbi:MAG TPA: chaperone modulator CbpM [Gammaproteobacteria bacterium]|nr:chaperone modulator CbpM [Gammaproteobacteria bacterium]
MPAEKTTVLMLDEELVFTLRELSRSCDLAAEDLIAMVEEGVLAPRGASPSDWRFPAADLRRVHTALRLQRDLGVNLAGVALALEMLDEMQALRARVRVLERLLD